MSDVSSVADWLSEIFSELGVGAKSVALLLTAILDSSLLSLPEINDALIFYFSALSPADAFFFVLAATVGSVSGCLLLNRLAYWKGPELVAKLSHRRSVRAGIRMYHRYGVWTLVVPALLPPPCPFKIFVVSSGALGLELHRFVLAVTIGRVLRYSLGAVLAVRYGEHALALLEAHAPYVVGVIVALTILVVAYAIRQLASRSRLTV